MHRESHSREEGDRRRHCCLNSLSLVSTCSDVSVSLSLSLDRRDPFNFDRGLDKGPVVSLSLSPLSLTKREKIHRPSLSHSLDVILPCFRRRL